ncbi:phage shock protein PspC (stress-responsive transcriptional regulator) [Motilibacter peucedani]|uniref:Phage shock protein PspC (Stress-responsive transcriptional regulator) n=1 Tax=Motilibacter peucedani TaxID=598650 RepID=A0A420XLN4_9ACTN|nr:PspC domain-containing protein [Motilibacter peucedani]RKS69335.1 phage shock protein PspC (stress-responsive transcriptional regulator) [Motilibacter peucedani]
MTPNSGPGSAPAFLRSLRRSALDRKVAGVCGGVARSLRIDPLILRVVAVVLAVFGGAGVLLYSLAWLLLPEEGEEESGAERLVRGRGDSSVIAPIVGVLVGLALFGRVLDDGPSGFVVIVTFLVVGTIVALRSDRPTAGVPVGGPAEPRREDSFGRTAGTAYAPAGTAYAAAATAYAPTGPVFGPVHGPPLPPPPVAPWPVPPPREPRPPRPPAGPLAALTLSGMLVVTCAASIAAWVFGAQIGVTFVLGAALVALGVGVAAASLWGRAGGLPLLGALLAVALIVAGVVRDEVPTHGWGDVTLRPTTVAQAQQPVERAAGDVTLDLRDVPFTGGPVHVRVRQAVGELLVLVPPDVSLDVQADVHWVGEVRLPDSDTENGASVSKHVVEPAVGSRGTLVMDLDLTVGDLEVRR